MDNLGKHALRAGSFVHNNGKVLRTVNILRLKYNKLTGVQSVLEDDGIAEDEFLDSVNFLAEEGYIHLRRISTRESAALADTDYTALEAKLTGKGIRLLAGGVKDDMIEV
ncbi:type VI secretion protein [Anaerotruncus colihominis]|uniref:Type VI secretion protein n=1 Tax=Anaerotruncus colihominis TaxID=169435 RepID=A0A845REY0_9FIRM|nr:type VI secretion protein [Anaerotruncus colihominis]